jgi:hypothetical protein
MQFKRPEEGHWVSDDAMQLHFFARKPPEAFPDQTAGPPAVFKAERVGHDGCYDPCGPINVPVQNLQLLAAVNFGEARLCWAGSETRWSGDSFRFGIYRVLKDDGTPEGRCILLVEVNGAGMFFYHWQQADSLRLWENLVATLPEPRLWDLIHGLVGTWRKGGNCERDRLHKLIVAGRIKRRKVRGKDAWTVEVSPPEEPVV